MQSADFQHKSIESAPNGLQSVKTTEKVPERVGEWPALLTKKFLAIQFDCFSNGRIDIRKFRLYVLTPEVLDQAGIDQSLAYSRNLKTFNAIQSMKLSKIFRGLCLASILFITGSIQAQTQTPKTNFPLQFTPAPTILQSADVDSIAKRDTTLGLVVLMDSTIRMQQIGRGQYAYQSVVGLIVLEARMIQEYKSLVSGKDGKGQPVETGRRFFLITGEPLREDKILMFKTLQK